MCEVRTVCPCTLRVLAATTVAGVGLWFVHPVAFLAGWVVLLSAVVFLVWGGREPVSARTVEQLSRDRIAVAQGRADMARHHARYRRRLIGPGDRLLGAGDLPVAELEEVV